MRANQRVPTGLLPEDLMRHGPRRLNLNDLSAEQRERLPRYLPTELCKLLARPRSLPPADRAAIHEHLRFLLLSLTATAPRWVVEAISVPQPRLALGMEATLLFADVTGFTPLTEQLDRMGRVGNEHITGILNRYFDVVVELALERGGDLLAFGGDAILVCFSGPNHAAHAAAAAWSMQEAM